MSDRFTWEDGEVEVKRAPARADMAESLFFDNRQAVTDVGKKITPDKQWDETWDEYYQRKAKKP